MDIMADRNIPAVWHQNCCWHLQIHRHRPGWTQFKIIVRSPSSLGWFIVILKLKHWQWCSVYCTSWSTTRNREQKANKDSADVRTSRSHVFHSRASGFWSITHLDGSSFMHALISTLVLSQYFSTYILGLQPEGQGCILLELQNDIVRSSEK